MEDIVIQMPFGISENNVLVHISEIEKGNEYSCKCLSCGTALIAVKGTVRAHHFRHYTTTDCSGESVIHKAAKQIITEKKQITLPDNNKIILFDSVQDEVKIESVIADLLATVGDRQLIIEIFYRHKVDAEKIDKLKKLNISAIEINLSDLNTGDVENMEAFWKYINTMTRIQWLHKSDNHNDRMIEAIKQFKALGIDADSYPKALETVNAYRAANAPHKAIRRKYVPGSRYSLPPRRVR